MLIKINVSPMHHDGDAEEPTLAVLQMTPELAARIRLLGDTAKRLSTQSCKIFKIERFDYSPTWYGDCCADDPENLESDDTITIERKAIDMDCPTLNVSEDEYWWEGLLHKTDLDYQTDPLKIADLPVASTRTKQHQPTPHERKLRKTLRAMIKASDDLTGAIEGATDQFDHEKERLMDATSAAEKALKAPHGRPAA